MQFTNPCTRCGMCCISETCKIGQDFYSIGKHTRCPALSFDDRIASCAFAEIGLMPGIGVGCCMSARVVKDGVTYDFASMPSRLKQIAVAQVLSPPVQGTRREEYESARAARS